MFESVDSRRELEGKQRLVPRASCRCGNLRQYRFRFIGEQREIIACCRPSAARKAGVGEGQLETEQLGLWDVD